MQLPCAPFNEYENFRAWLDGAGTPGYPTPFEAALQNAMGGVPYGGPPKPSAMIVAAPEDPPWAPAWIWAKEPTMKQFEGFACAIVLIVALVYWDRIPKPIWFLALFAVVKVWAKGAVDNAVHNEKEKLRLDGRLLPKAAANPLYNIVPIPM
jgi:hypothetical protein